RGPERRRLSGDGRARPPGRCPRPGPGLAAGQDHRRPHPRLERRDDHHALMAGDRYVVLGVAQARSGWFRAVAQWSNSAAIPVEFVKCVSVEEVRARLASGRTFSALVADGGLPSVDRDVLAAARQAGAAVLVVDD